jgi:hypothetical protein
MATVATGLLAWQWQRCVFASEANQRKRPAGHLGGFVSGVNRANRS